MEQSGGEQIGGYNPKLEGIQKGIEVFGDMTFKQINFIAKKLRSIPVVRGCHNICSHCILCAKSPIREDETHINKMAHEDFKALVDGFKELNQRIGYNIFDSNHCIHTCNSLFYDSDCADVCLTDKNGVEHSFEELSDMYYNMSNMKMLFDTAGWNPKDKAAQERMERTAKYYAKDENWKKLFKFNFSVNPFHSIYTASVKALKAGNKQKAEEYRNIFIDRTVNALFAITPAIEVPNFDYIPRAMNDATKGGEGFRVQDTFLLYVDVFKKLEERYLEDLNSEEPKYIHSKEQMKSILGKLYLKLRDIEPIQCPAGRLLELYPDDDPALDFPYKYRRNVLQHLQNIMGSDSQLFGVLDINGQFYISTEISLIKTGLAFNFKNKDKKTAPIGPHLMDFVLTNDLLESII